jgi:hypothetical protein
MPIRVKRPISILFVGAALTAKWVSASPAHNWARFDVRKADALIQFAEAS